jgi:hypothetical protein
MNCLLYEICALLGYHAELSGRSVPTFRDNRFVPIVKGQDFLTLEDGTDKLSRNLSQEVLTLEDWPDMLSRNVGTELPLNAA